ncbi:CYTH domain-containing protein [Candidatus Dojkabacteria bacterium]|uniref:CYTH domain-containing protein n=1 Tax=Candidatus Dojkabacteria bacterium TaxID=2099670 RepID=A0A955RJM4_9BACT|nr:CYTH domain-containing protein [Candidatus Dojkabacteria bacterium]
MGKEIEAKFINIDKPQIINKLEELGATKVFDERLLRRCVYNLPIEKFGAWARIRDEVDKVTMTYKRVLDQSLDGVEEIELVIDDFDNGRSFLKSIGLLEKAYQETKRIRYTLGSIEFDIDTWPALNPWIEIEAATSEDVQKYAELLGFNWEDAMFGSADFVYERVYKIDADWINNQCPVLKFDELPPELQESNLR